MGAVEGLSLESGSIALGDFRRQEDQLELDELADQAAEVLRPAEWLLGEQSTDQIGQFAGRFRAIAA
jgi:hypothetical protein